MMTNMGEIVVGHDTDIENYHTLVNIMLQGSDQLTEQENIQIWGMMKLDVSLTDGSEKFIGFM